MKYYSMEEMRDRIVTEIQKKGIDPVQIAYESGVSQSTVYNFLGKRSFNKRIVDWYLAKYKKGDK